MTLEAVAVLTRLSIICSSQLDLMDVLLLCGWHHKLVSAEFLIVATFIRSHEFRGFL